jgi:hypothetical protein
MRYSNLEETYISRRILHNTDTLVPSLYQCVEPRSTEVLWLLSQPLPHLRFNLFNSETFAKFLDPLVKRFTRQTLPTANRKHFFMNIHCNEAFCSQKTHNRTFLLGSTLHKQGRNFDYWNQPLTMRIHVCYLDFYEAVLCCHLVIHVENQLRPLQLFYFQLWPIYWLLLVRYEVLTAVVVNSSLLGYNAMHSVESRPTFRSNMSQNPLLLSLWFLAWLVIRFWR